jgi:hypothetical protein
LLIAGEEEQAVAADIFLIFQYLSISVRDKFGVAQFGALIRFAVLPGS